VGEGIAVSVGNEVVVGIGSRAGVSEAGAAADGFKGAEFPVVPQAPTRKAISTGNQVWRNCFIGSLSA
jgi:hypothetical protein